MSVFKLFFSIFFHRCILKYKDSPLKIQWISETEFRVVETIIIEVHNSPFGHDYSQFIFSGFESDGASIPWIFQPLIGAKTSIHNIRGAVAHDELYRDNPQSISSDNNRFVTRAEADFILFLILKKDKMPLYKCILIYYAVRFFGWSSFQQNNKNKEIKICNPST